MSLPLETVRSRSGATSCARSFGVRAQQRVASTTLARVHQVSSLDPNCVNLASVDLVSRVEMSRARLPSPECGWKSAPCPYGLLQNAHRNQPDPRRRPRRSLGVLESSPGRRCSLSYDSTCCCLHSWLSWFAKGGFFACTWACLGSAEDVCAGSSIVVPGRCLTTAAAYSTGVEKALLDRVLSKKKKIGLEERSLFENLCDLVKPHKQRRLS